MTLALVTAATASVKACVLVTPPPVAVIVRVEVWAAAVEAAVSLSVLVPAPGEAMLVGVKVAVTPLGSPLMERATAALKPFPRAVVKLTVAEPPGTMVALVVLAVRANVPVTVR